MKNYCTTSDITKALDIPFGRLREWIIRGYIKPSIPSPGQGQAAEFTIDEVYRIQIFRTMIEGGLSRERAAEFLACTRERKDPWLHSYLVIAFRRAKDQVLPMVTKQDDPDGINKGGRNEFVLDLETGFLGPPTENSLDSDGRADKNWTDIYIVNLRAIREYVNSGMKGR